MAEEVLAATVAAEAPPAEETVAAAPPAPVLSEHGNDISTLTGFLDEYDWHATHGRDAHQWCQLEFAYQNGSHRYGNFVPYNGTTRTQHVPSVPWEHLSELGQAHYRKQEAKLLEKYKIGALRAAEYGVLAPRRYLTLIEANYALRCLGLPEMTWKVRFKNYTKDHFYWYTPEMIPDGMTAVIQAEMREALKAIVLKHLPNAVMRGQGHEISVSRGTGGDKELMLTDEARALAGDAVSEFLKIV
jgi:hypothetical protein